MANAQPWGTVESMVRPTEVGYLLEDLDHWWVVGQTITLQDWECDEYELPRGSTARVFLCNEVGRVVFWGEFFMDEMLCWRYAREAVEAARQVTQRDPDVAPHAVNVGDICRYDRIRLGYTNSKTLRFKTGREFIRGSQ